MNSSEQERGWVDGGRWPGLGVLGFVGLMALAAFAGCGRSKPERLAMEFAVPEFPTFPTNAMTSTAGVGPIVGTVLGQLSDLNGPAVKADAVLVFLPGSEGNAPAEPLRGAARTIHSSGANCGVYTLSMGSRDYLAMAQQVKVPSVVVFARGGGIVPVSGEITETRLVQGYLEALGSGGCCGGGPGRGRAK